MRITLTDLAVRNLKASGKQEHYICKRTPNFGVRVNQIGTKTFFAVVGKERRRISLGKYPQTSLQEARRAASELAIHDTVPVALGDAIERCPSSKFPGQLRS